MKQEGHSAYIILENEKIILLAGGGDLPNQVINAKIKKYHFFA